MKTPSDERPDTAEFELIEIKGNCALNVLTLAQQQLLFDWLEIHPLKLVLEMVAAPKPDGFGINTHVTTLRRFHLRARAHFKTQLAADISGLHSGAQNAIANGDNLALQALGQSTLELAMLHQAKPSSIASLGRWIVRLQEKQQRDRGLNLLEQRLALEKEKFEFNAARLAAGHFNQIKDVMADPKTDDEDKIWKIREGIFGPRSNLIEPQN
jgi:hypothetical protein